MVDDDEPWFEDIFFGEPIDAGDVIGDTGPAADSGGAGSPGPDAAALDVRRFDVARPQKHAVARRRSEEEEDPVVINVNIHNHLKDMPAPHLHVVAQEVVVPPTVVNVAPAPVTVQTVPAPQVNVEVQAAPAAVTVEPARPIVHNEIKLPEAAAASEDFEVEVLERDPTTGRPTKFRRRPRE